jgi:hypothetical protein
MACATEDASAGFLVSTRACGRLSFGLLVALFPDESMKTGLRASIAVCVMAVLLAGTLAPAAAQSRLPDAGVVLIVEIRDTAGWLAVYDQVLRTAGQGNHAVGVSVPGTSPRRSVTLTEPRFTVNFVKSSEALTITVTGKVAGRDTVAALGGFQEAVLTSHGSDGELELSYGLASVAAYLIELYLSRD